jgi:hypothetical protein
MLKSIDIGSLPSSADVALKAPLASPVFTGVSDFSAGGAYFGTAAAANILDDYEKGTFTPTIATGASATTISSATGNYTKIGRLIHCLIYIAGDWTTDAVDLSISGLPFVKAASAGVGWFSGGSCSGTGLDKSVISCVRITPSTSVVSTMPYVDGSSNVKLATSTSKDIEMSFSYFTN